MKIRNGFVSNSSSSSFVVAFPKKPETVQDVINALWPYQTELVKEYDWHDEVDLSVETVGATILDCIQNQKYTVEHASQHGTLLYNGHNDRFDWWSQDIDLLHENLEHYYNELHKEEPSESNEEKRIKIADEIQKCYNEQKEITKKMSELAIEELKLKAKNRFGDGYQLYTFEFSDGDGEYYCELEHGMTFENVPYIKVSRH